MMWRRLCPEVGSVVYNRAYFIDFIFETPPTWRVMFLYLFPPGKGYSSYTPEVEVIILVFIVYKLLNCKTHVP
jgi:hypothetical protein